MSMAQSTVGENGYRFEGFFDPRRIHPLRSMILFALGTLIGLGIAGYGLFTAEGTVTHSVPPENMALVNRKPILRTDFIAQIEAEYSLPFGQTSREQRLKVLDDMIREELFVQRGLELDFPGTDPDTRTALVAAVVQQVVADVTTRTPSEEELRKFYQENESAYASEGSMTLHNFLIRTADPAGAGARETALKAAEALRAGASPDDLLKRFAIQELVPEHASPEQFYFAQKAHIGDALFTRAAAMDNGDISEPIAEPDGLHLLQMVKNVRPTPASFDKARSHVLNDYQIAAKKKLEEADLRYLRDKADILIAEDYADDYEAAQAAAKP
jgi:hypothetical protein